MVVVTATNPGDSATLASAPSAATLPAPPVNTTPPPAPTGTGVDGGTLTAAPGTWTGDGTITYTYQWQRCDADGTDCADIDDATDETYSPVPADVGHAVVVEVTATNAGGSTTEASAPTAAPIAAAPPVNTVPPSVDRRRGRRRDADRQPGHLDRHADDRLRLPVAALRRRRDQLRGHRRRDGRDLHARARRHRPHHHRRGHGDQRGR